MKLELSFNACLSGRPNRSLISDGSWQQFHRNGELGSVYDLDDAGRLRWLMYENGVTAVDVVEEEGQ